MPSRKVYNFIIVLVTTSKLYEAKKIAQALLVKREAACINIIKGVSSLFRWKGKIQREKEVLLIIKTKRRLFRKMLKTIKKNHSYSVPEIIALPIVAGDEPYLEWIDEILN
jgi:periplasmic divalent cation tolerance protein